MTKASIVQRLLDEKQITAEEAVVLLQSEAPLTNLPQPYTPYIPPTFPINPMQPYYPSYPGTPYVYGPDSTK